MVGSAVQTQPQSQLTECTKGGVTLLSNVQRNTQSTAQSSAGVTFAFTTRGGGVSRPPYASCNLGMGVGDDPQAVLENRRRVLEALGHMPLAQHLLVPSQIHSDIVCSISKPEQFDEVRQQIAEGCDAIVCTTPDVAVLLCFADCTPVVLVADSDEAVEKTNQLAASLDATNEKLAEANRSSRPGFAVVHSGWRGTKKRIAARALEELCAQTGCVPSQVHAWVGPHISAAAYEVSEELIDSFVDDFGESVRVGERNLDMSRAIYLTLCEAGLVSEHFYDVQRCTVGEVDTFFSYRAEHGQCGRHGAIAFMSDK